MDEAEKRQRMAEHLSSLGVRRGAYAPPFYRALWRLGFDLPPPLFSGFLAIALPGGAFFGAAWGLAFGALARIIGLPVPDPFIGVTALGCGALFGLVMAFLVRREARRLGLPRWSDYTPPT